MYTIEQLTKTFERIGLTFDPAAKRDYALLAAVQYAFQKTIPYENLDILRGVPLSLDPGDLYEKITVNRRGGYCFEINGFLGEVLRSLGYGVTEYMARYLRGETEIPVRRHRVLRVTGADGVPYLCDAGIGQSAFRLPLKLEDGAVSEQYGETYRIAKEEFLGWVVSDLHDGEWRKFYSFTEEVQLNIDFAMPSFWCENAEESPFRGAEMFSIKTDTGRVTLDGNVYRVFDGGNVTEKILTEDEVRGVYGSIFGLPYCEGLKLRRKLVPAQTERARKAEALFRSGCNCAQAVFCAFEDLTGLDHETSLRLGSSYGGGFGRLREVCGAFSGACGVIGILYGYTELEDKTPKKEHYALIQRMAAEFKETRGSYICRELLEGIEESTSSVPSDRTAEYYDVRPCPGLVAEAAVIVERIIAEKGLPQRG